MVDKRNMSTQLSAVQFAMWELHLYLDTHPDDDEKLCLLNSYKEKYASMLPEYEAQYGPISPASGSGCAWLKTPFPWVKGGAC